MDKGHVLLNVLFLLIFLPIQSRQIFSSFEGRSNILTNHCKFEFN